MPFDPAFLKAFEFADSRQDYSERDTILYALGLGVGSRPTDPDQLQFVYEKSLKALPTMGVVLAHPGFWAADPQLGIDTTRLLHVEQGLTIHRPIASSGAVIGRSRITGVSDRGADKGALLFFERQISDLATDELIATSRQVLLCRGNGGFGGDAPAVTPLPSVPDRTPDVVVRTRTLPQAALIYRLSGDVNPLHADPTVAARAGFDSPILHGLATYGIGGLVVLEGACGWDPARLESFDVRFSAPVVPGETLDTELWIDQEHVSVRTRSVERDRIVMNNGRAVIRAR